MSYVVRQLAAVFWSIIAPDEGEHTRKTAQQLGEFSGSARMIGQLKIRKLVTNL